MWKADEVEAQNSSELPKGICVHSWGEPAWEKRRQACGLTSRCFLFREGVWGSTLQSPFHIPTRTWMHWRSHWWTGFQNTGLQKLQEPHLESLESSAFLFYFVCLFVCNGRLLPSWDWHHFGVEVLGPGRSGKCNSVHKTTGMPWKKIQDISFINAGLPIPLNSENPFKWLLPWEG